MKNKIWFRKRKGLFSKDLGYGWMPVSWEGYAMIFLFILVNILGVLYFRFPYAEGSTVNFFIILISSIIIFSIIAKYKTKK